VYFTTTTKKLKMKYIFSAIVLLLSGLSLLAQNSTSSPYSKFGIGELEMAAGGRNAGMGETGIALRSSMFFNSANPASLTAIEPQSFLFDMGFNYKYTQLSNTEKKANVTDGNISWVQMGFPISKKLYGGFSVNPKSSVGYDIYLLKTIEGTTFEYPSIYQGSGGLSESALMLAWKLSKNISLGGKGGYIWGNVTQTIDQTVSLSSTTYEILQTDNIHYSGGYFNLGTQITVPLNSKSSLVFGALAGLSSDMKAKISTTITKSYSSVSEVISSTNKNSYAKKLPLDLGTGVSFLYGLKWVGTFDYKRSNWNDANLIFDANKLTTNNSYRAGVEFAPKEEKQSFRQTVRYRMGYRYETGYLKLFNNQIHEQALSIGFGMPIRKDKSYANFSLEFGTRGTKTANLVKENFVKFNCSLNLFDRWFYKRQID
jgi:hypothetical protein